MFSLRSWPNNRSCSARYPYQYRTFLILIHLGLLVNDVVLLKINKPIDQQTYYYGHRIGVVPQASFNHHHHHQNLIPSGTQDCSGDSPFGMYADIDSGCQAYFVCHAGRRDTFMCPQGTLFNQELLTCDYWYKVACSGARGGLVPGTGQVDVVPDDGPNERPETNYSPYFPSYPSYPVYPSYPSFPVFPQVPVQPSPPSSYNPWPGPDTSAIPDTVPNPPSESPYQPEGEVESPSPQQPPTYNWNNWQPTEEPEWTFAWMKRFEPTRQKEPSYSNDYSAVTKQNFDFILENHNQDSMAKLKEVDLGPNPWLFPIASSEHK